MFPHCGAAPRALEHLIFSALLCYAGLSVCAYETKECQCHAIILFGGKIEMVCSKSSQKCTFEVAFVFVHVVKMKNWWDAWDKNGRTTQCYFISSNSWLLNNYDSLKPENRSIRSMHFYKLPNNAPKYLLLTSFSPGINFLLMPCFFFLSSLFCLLHNVILVNIMNIMWSSIFVCLHVEVTTANSVCLSELWQTASH